jgi:hypothetical protein
MPRRIVALAFSPFLLLGMMAVSAPASSAADSSWTTLARQCVSIKHEGLRTRACQSIKLGVIDDEFTIRNRCRVKMLNWEARYIEMRECYLYDGDTSGVLTSAPDRTRYGVTGLIVKTPLILCDPNVLYFDLMVFEFRDPDGSLVSWGLQGAWASSNDSVCSPPT